MSQAVSMARNLAEGRVWPCQLLAAQPAPSAGWPQCDDVAAALNTVFWPHNQACVS